MGCFQSHPAPLPPPLQIQTPGNFSSSDPNISQSWVYFKIIEHNANQIFYAYNLHVQKSLPFPDFPEGLVNSATAVLSGILYVIGGTDFDGKASKHVYMCDPMTAFFTWSQLPSTKTPRQNAVVVAANGRIYVFGGCRHRHRHRHRHRVNVPWAEVYNPSSLTRRWTAIQNPPQGFSSSLSRHPLQAVVFRDQIFIRNECRGISYNVTSSRWERLPEIISKYWLKWSSAVEVSGVFVAYHQERIGTAILRAYDPEQALWLPIDTKPIVPANMSQLLSVNGKFATCNVGIKSQDDQLTFTVMQMEKNPTRKRMAVHIENELTFSGSAEGDLVGPAHAANP